MAENKEKLEATVTEENVSVETETPENDALKSYLERESSVDTEKKEDKKPKKLSKNVLWIIIAVVAIMVIVGIVLLLKFAPTKTEPAEIDPGTPITLTVDENGEHQASLLLDKKGKLENNSYGTLIEYTPSDIKQIDVENQSGTFTILSETPKTVDEETGEETTGATIYTLVGFEDVELLGGGPDTVANDVAHMDFTSVADPSGKKASDFGFDKPRATVKTTYTDDTTATIIVGDDVPSQMGTYVMFGNSKAVYIVASDAVDGLLFSVLDLVTLEVNKSPSTTENSQLESLTLSGSAYSSKIEIVPNNDKAIDSTYVMTSPKKMFASETETTNISGAIRGLYADEAVCVNPSSSQLSEYGLSSVYAQLTAVYPDTTVTLKASKPSDDSVYLIADSNIIYKISADKVPWIYTNVFKLVPDVVINPNFDSLSNITVTDEKGTYSFDMTTISDTVTNTDGVDETVNSTTAYYKGKKLNEDNFYVFYQNICNMENAGKADSGASGSPVLTIELSYSTGRATDVVDIYATGNTKYIASLNGEVQSLVYKSFCTKFSQSVQDLITGKTVSSF